MVVGRISQVVTMASVVVLGATAAASALESVQVGRWMVFDGVDERNPAVCSALLSQPNGSDLRLLTDGRSWQVGTAYYGPKKKIDVYYGFETAGERANLIWDGSTWANLKLEEGQLDAFRELPVFAITLGGKENRWKLAGAGAAIDRTLECSRNRGLRAAAAAPRPAPPMAAPPMAAPPMPQEAPPMPGAAVGECPPKGSLRSQNSARAVTIKFHNSTKGPIDIMWVDYQGEWKKYHTLAPEALVQQKTFVTHPWLAVDGKGRCLGGVMTAEPNSSGEESANFYQIMDE